MWHFPRQKAPIKCIHARQGIRASSARVTAFFSYADHENSVRVAYAWALGVAKGKHVAKNGISKYNHWICMHYSMGRTRNFIGVFSKEAHKKLQSKSWNASALRSTGPNMLYCFELSPRQNKLFFSGAIGNPIAILAKMLYRQYWRLWNAASRRLRLQETFDAWRTSDFVII